MGRAIVVLRPAHAHVRISKRRVRLIDRTRIQIIVNLTRTRVHVCAVYTRNHFSVIDKQKNHFDFDFKPPMKNVFVFYKYTLKKNSKVLYVRRDQLPFRSIRKRANTFGKCISDDQSSESKN